MAETMATLTTAVQDTKHTFGTAETLTKATNYTTKYDGYVVMQQSGAEVNTWASMSVNSVQMLVAATGAYQLSAHIMNSLFVRKGTNLYFNTNGTTANTWAKFYPITS